MFWGVRTHWEVSGRLQLIRLRSPRPTCILLCSVPTSPASPCDWTCACAVSSVGNSWGRARRCTQCGDLPWHNTGNAGHVTLTNTRNSQDKHNVGWVIWWCGAKEMLSYHRTNLTHGFWACCNDETAQWQVMCGAYLFPDQEETAYTVKLQNWIMPTTSCTTVKTGNDLMYPGSHYKHRQGRNSPILEFAGLSRDEAKVFF